MFSKINQSLDKRRFLLCKITQNKVNDTILEPIKSLTAI